MRSKHAIKKAVLNMSVHQTVTHIHELETELEQVRGVVITHLGEHWLTLDDQPEEPEPENA
jgi:hypothetical protein